MIIKIVALIFSLSLAQLSMAIEDASEVTLVEQIELVKFHKAEVQQEKDSMTSEHRELGDRLKNYYGCGADGCWQPSSDEEMQELRNTRRTFLELGEKIEARHLVWLDEIEELNEKLIELELAAIANGELSPENASDSTLEEMERQERVANSIFRKSIGQVIDSLTPGKHSD